MDTCLIALLRPKEADLSLTHLVSLKAADKEEGEVQCVCGRMGLPRRESMKCFLVGRALRAIARESSKLTASFKSMWHCLERIERCNWVVSLSRT